MHFFCQISIFGSICLPFFLLHIPRFIIHFPRCLDPCFFGWFFPGASPQVETWGLLATAWARQGETEKAAKWLRQAAKCEGVRFLVDVGTLLWCLCWGVPVCWQEFFFSKAFISSIFMFSLCQAELMHTHTQMWDDVAYRHIRGHIHRYRDMYGQTWANKASFARWWR